MQTGNFKKIQRVLWIILIANLGVAALKIAMGFFIRSSSLQADGFHSLTDGSSNIVGLIGIFLASKPEDREHPYGHKKMETFAGLFIAAMLLFLAGRIIYGAVQRFTSPVFANVTVESILALTVTLGINIFVSYYEFKQGKKLKSDILISDSMHTRSDIFISIGVLITLLGVKLGLPPTIDPIASLVVSGFILYAACEIFKSTSGTLLDRSAIDPDKVKEIVMGFKQVKECHKIRSRGREDEVFIDMHIMTTPNMSIEESHTLAHNIENELNTKLNKSIQVTSHFEPYFENNLESNPFVMSK